MLGNLFLEKMMGNPKKIKCSEVATVKQTCCSQRPYGSCTFATPFNPFNPPLSSSPRNELWDAVSLTLWILTARLLSIISIFFGQLGKVLLARFSWSTPDHVLFTHLFSNRSGSSSINAQRKSLPSSTSTRVVVFDKRL